MSAHLMSSEIYGVARTCVVIECNGMGILLLMSGYAPARMSGASIGPLGDGATYMRLPPADEAASQGERFPHPGRHKGTVQAAP